MITHWKNQLIWLNLTLSEVRVKCNKIFFLIFQQFFLSGRGCWFTRHFCLEESPARILIILDFGFSKQKLLALIILAGAEPLNKEGSPPHHEAGRWSSRWRIRWSNKKKKNFFYMPRHNRTGLQTYVTVELDFVWGLFC